jgi:predicted short-subunit dehydrogenase-like oxidoreductase (DUF2520 family)
VEVAIIGAGRTGTAVAVLLVRAGHRVIATTGRVSTPARVARWLPGVPVVVSEPDPPGPEAVKTIASADLVILGVPDGAIAATVERWATAGAFGAPRAVGHLSGATPLAVLDPAASSGATVLALHPLQTFPDVEPALARIPGSWMAVTAADAVGSTLGHRLAADLECHPFDLREEDRALYHAAAVIASNHLVALEAQAIAAMAAAVEPPAERVPGAGGARPPEPIEILRPLLEATLANLAAAGPAAALTGPAARGDAGTLDANLRALASSLPAAVPAYVTLAAAAIELAVASGRLHAAEAVDAIEVLDRWR